MENDLRILGVDPGLGGACALLTETGRYIAVHDMPTMLANKTGDKRQINVAELASMVGMSCTAM